MLAVLSPVRPARELSDNRSVTGVGLGNFRAVSAAAFLYALWIAPLFAFAVILMRSNLSDEALETDAVARLHIRKLATGSLHKVQHAGTDMTIH